MDVYNKTKGILKTQKLKIGFGKKMPHLDRKGWRKKIDNNIIWNE